MCKNRWFKPIVQLTQAQWESNITKDDLYIVLNHSKVHFTILK